MAKHKASLAIATAFLITLLLLGISEAVIRLIVYTNPDTGVLMIGRFALLPYRPKPDAARAAVAREEKVDESTYIVRDRDLGWSIRANGESGLYSATSQGFRGPKGWSTTASIPQRKIRICIYGDSFTHGDRVSFKDTWGDQLQHLHTSLQVLNFGVPAYGTDQAYLRFLRDGKKFDAQIQILGIWPEDMVRNLNLIRFFLNPQGSLGTSKPRFVLAHNDLKLVNWPVMSDETFLNTVLQESVTPVERYDFWYRRNEQRFPFYYHLRSIRALLSVYNAYERREIRNRQYFDKQSEAMKITVAIAEAFQRIAKARGSLAYVAIIPMRDFLEEHGSGAFPLVKALEEHSVHVLDFGPAFASRAKEVGVNALYLPDGHLSPEGNKLLAEEMNRSLATAFHLIKK
jgi:lysophospholipase L1-like esterase